MCNCKEEIEKKVLEKFKNEIDGEDHAVELTGYALIFRDDGVIQRPVMPIEQKYLHTFKNGNKKVKTIKISMALSHCPFCGEKVAA